MLACFHMFPYLSDLHFSVLHLPPLGSWHPKQKLQEVAEKKSTQLDFLFAVWESREAVASKQTALLETESENSES